MKRQQTKQLFATMFAIILSAKLFAGTLCLTSAYGDQIEVNYTKTSTHYFSLTCTANLAVGGTWSGYGYYDANIGKMNIYLFNAFPDDCTTFADYVVIRANSYDMTASELTAVYINRCYGSGEVGTGHLNWTRTDGACGSLRMSSSVEPVLGLPASSDSQIAMIEKNEDGESILKMFEENTFSVATLAKDNFSILYSISENSDVELSIVNIAGQKIKTLLIEKQDAGIFDIAWDGTTEQGNQAADGIYIAVIKINGIITAKQFVK